MSAVKVEKIYGDAADKYVAATVLYGKTGLVYFDKEGKNKVSKEELADFFVKGVVVVYENLTYKPICLSTTGANATISIITYSGSALTKVDLKSA